MLKLVNSLLVAAMLVAGFFTYSLEYSIRKSEREIAATKAKIRDARETQRLLEAEWAMLARPSRLQRLAEQHLKMGPMKAKQMMGADKAYAALPRRSVKPKSVANDAERLKAILETVGQ